MKQTVFMRCATSEKKNKKHMSLYEKTSSKYDTLGNDCCILHQNIIRYIPLDKQTYLDIQSQSLGIQTDVKSRNYMFDVFDLFISSYPYILISLCLCVLPCISHPYILISSGSYALAYIPASSYTQFRVCLLAFLHPHVIISSGS